MENRRSERFLKKPLFDYKKVMIFFANLLQVKEYPFFYYVHSLISLIVCAYEKIKFSNPQSNTIYKVVSILK